MEIIDVKNLENLQNNCDIEKITNYNKLEEIKIKSQHVNENNILSTENEIKQALQDNKVLLWGEHAVSSLLLKEYDKGNKNPYSRKVTKTSEIINKKIKKEKPIIKTFLLKETYSQSDLPWLNEELKRLEKTTDYDMYDALYEVIDSLEVMEELNNNLAKNREIDLEINFNTENKEHELKIKCKNKIPELKIESEKNLSEIKQTIKKKNTNNKKNLSKCIENIQKISETKKQNIEEKNKLTIGKKLTGKPWYYIGEISNGYRPATQYEAIKAKKVSYYGKYVVNEKFWTIYRDYNILLDPDKNLNETIGCFIGLKNKLEKTARNIEIYKNKEENDKYTNLQKEQFAEKLKNTISFFNILCKACNWYYKKYCLMTFKEYKKKDFSYLLKPNNLDNNQ